MKTPQEWVDGEMDQLRAFRQVAVAVSVLAVCLLFFKFMVLANTFQSLCEVKGSIQELKAQMSTTKIP